jgi:cell division protein FtsA
MNLTTQIITALDIGTRTVTGIIGRIEKGRLNVLACHSIEHTTRAMHDGQIQDIEQVAFVIEKVKEMLESLAGTSIKGAIVAAAGRSLETHTGKASRVFPSITEISQEDVTAVEIEATQAASESLANKMDMRNYYCIDYNVISYSLDNERIRNPVGQRAEKLSIEVIATFLPRMVVDSLEKALELVGLELAGLTLEPIAASNVVIPEDMRSLNIVLVDIGAGTSDIAISRDGSIFSYGMVPQAGDEITDAICKKYLVEFAVAEKIKKTISKSKTVKYKNILGLNVETKSDDIQKDIAPYVQELATSIADRILALNDFAPDAVLCVGGGSLTPGLPEKISEKLGIEKVRVAIRGTDAVKNISGHLKMTGPEYVTPLGIALSHTRHSELMHCNVKVNKKNIRIIHLGSITAKDAILASGIPLKEIRGNIGRAVTFELNEQIQLIKGKHGVPALIMRNDQEIPLDAEITDGDSIEIISGNQGEGGLARISEFLPPTTNIFVSVNGEEFQVPFIVICNGVITFEDFIIQDQDKIRIVAPESLEEILQALQHFPADYITETISFWINGMELKSERTNYSITLNGEPADMHSKIINGDAICIQGAIFNAPTIKDLMLRNEYTYIEIDFNGKPLQIETTNAICKVNGKKVKPSYRLANGDSLQIYPGDAIFSDVFRHAEIDIKKLGSNFELKLNGEKAQYTNSIVAGDKLLLLPCEEPELSNG